MEYAYVKMDFSMIVGLEIVKLVIIYAKLVMESYQVTAYLVNLHKTEMYQLHHVYAKIITMTNKEP